MSNDTLAQIFKALAHAQRLQIFRLLCEWQDLDSPCEGVEKCFTRACGNIPLSRSTVSHHFKALQAAGLISARRTGQSFVYSVNPEAIAVLSLFLQQLPTQNDR